LERPPKRKSTKTSVRPLDVRDVEGLVRERKDVVDVAARRDELLALDYGRDPVGDEVPALAAQALRRYADDLRGIHDHDVVRVVPDDDLHAPERVMERLRLETHDGAPLVGRVLGRPRRRPRRRP